MTVGSAGPVVSVVMPFLDAARFLEEAVESARSQSFPHWELLLVDDGSTDGSTEIALRYARDDPARIRYLRHPRGSWRGASAARNLALASSRGEFVAFLDADDVWLPNKLEEQVPLLRSRPEAGMLYGNTLYWESWLPGPRRGDRMLPIGIPSHTLLRPPELLVRMLRREAAVPCMCSIILRRELIERVGGFDETFRSVYTDQVFYARVLTAAPVYVVHDCWDWYRQDDDSSVSTAQRDGRERAARGRYLDMVQSLLPQYLPAARKDLNSALRLARWDHRYPRLMRSYRRFGRKVRKLAKERRS